MSRRAAFLLLALLPLIAWAAGPSVQAHRVWIRQAPPGVSVLAGYFTLENLTDQAITLGSVSSPDFGAVEMHQSFVKNGMEGMAPVASVAIPAHGSIEFKPGGYHLMLMQPKKNLFAGDIVTLMFKFSDNSELAILAPVRHDAPQH